MPPTPIRIGRRHMLAAAVAATHARTRQWWRQRRQGPPPVTLSLPPWTPAETAEFRAAALDILADAHQSRPELAPSATDVVVLPWVCPACNGDGEGHGAHGRCLECGGRGAISTQDAQIWAEIEGVELRRTPTPPAVMPQACGSCAFRRGSPEDADGEQPSLDKAFYCHTGMPVVGGSYAPVAWAAGMPLGSMVCAGWWAEVTGQDPPERPYRAARDGWGEVRS